MRLRYLSTLVAVSLPIQATFAQDIGVKADQGYKTAYDAFCSGNDAHSQNILNLVRMKQITEDAFVEARLASLKTCPRISPMGQPPGTEDAIAKLRDPKRVFHLPQTISLSYLQNKEQPGGTASFLNYDHTRLTYHLATKPKDLQSLAGIMKAKPDVNWRNQLGYPVVYFAAWSSPEAFRMVVDASANVDVRLPKAPYMSHTLRYDSYVDFFKIEHHPGFKHPQLPGPPITLVSATLLPTWTNGAIWPHLQSSTGATQHLLDFVVQSCGHPRSPDCWQKLNIMFDKGIRPSKNLLHAFFDGAA